MVVARMPIKWLLARGRAIVIAFLGVWQSRVSLVVTEDGMAAV
jgi:hypothetical protein